MVNFNKTENSLNSGEKSHTTKDMTQIKFSVTQLLDKADENIDSFLYDIADKFCERALHFESDNIRALETSGFLKLELGRHDDAIKHFQKAVSLSPDVGHSKYMYLGQLHAGQEAATYFLKGIDILLKNKPENEGQEVPAACAPPNETPKDPTVPDVSTAYCSLAELYLTDLCFEEDAGARCKQYASQAIETASGNSEAYRIMADCMMSLCDTDGARDMIKKSVEIWMSRAKQEQTNETSDSEVGGDYNPVRVTPVPYDSRVNAAKILIELEEYDLSSDVLELLLDENESVAEVWYLLGWLNHLQGDDYRGNARFYLNKAHKVYTESGHQDPRLFAHIEELLEELGGGEEDDDEEDDESGSDVVIESDESDDETMDER